jgi:hypothetical protein
MTDSTTTTRPAAAGGPDIAAEYRAFERDQAAADAATGIGEILRLGRERCGIDRGVVGGLLEARGLLWISAHELSDHALDPYHRARGRAFARQAAGHLDELAPRAPDAVAARLRETADQARKAAG